MRIDKLTSVGSERIGEWMNERMNERWKDWRKTSDLVVLHISNVCVTDQPTNLESHFIIISHALLLFFLAYSYSHQHCSRHQKVQRISWPGVLFLKIFRGTQFSLIKFPTCLSVLSHILSDSISHFLVDLSVHSLVGHSIRHKVNFKAF